MNWYRTLLPLVVLTLLAARPLPADDASPVVFCKEFSADMLITAPDGTKMTNHMAVDDGKVRTDIQVHGMNMVAIIRPDEGKVYSVMMDQKMVMVMPYDPEKYKDQMAAATGVGGKFDLVGPDMVDGVACTKYKETSKEGQTYFVWVDANKTLVKMVSNDNTVILFKNYKAGPQDATQFEPPAGFQTVQLPGVQQIPTNGAGGAPQ